MKLKILLCLLLVFSVGLLQAQKLDSLWAFEHDSFSQSWFGDGMKDAAGNIYLCANTGHAVPQYYVDIQFGPGETKVVGVRKRLFKYDANFNLLWYREFESHLEIFFSGIENDRIYLSGTFDDTVDFDPDPTNVVNRISRNIGTSKIKESYYLLEMDTSGHFRRVQVFEGGKNTNFNNSHVLNMEPAPNKGWYLHATLDDSLDLDPGAGRKMVGCTPLTISERRYVSFVVLLDSNWQYQAHASCETDLDPFTTSFVDGKPMFSGSQRVTIYPESGDSITPTSSDDFVLIRYDEGLNYLNYAKPFGGVGSKSLHHKKDANGNNYLFGQFTGTFIFKHNGSPDTLVSNGLHDALILKVDNLVSINAEKVYHIGASGSESAYWTSPIGGTDHLFQIHMASGVVAAPSPDFDPGTGTTLVDKLPRLGMGIVRLDSDLNFRWAGSIKGPDFYPSPILALNDTTLFLFVYVSADGYFDPELSWQARNFYSYDNFHRMAFVKYHFPKAVNYEFQASSCDNEVYPFGHQHLSSSGTYTGTFQHASYGDSVVTLDLEVNPSYFVQSVTDTFCAKYAEYWRGQFIDKAGIYYDSLKTTWGCDSVFHKPVLYHAPILATAQVSGGALLATAGFVSYQWVDCNANYQPEQGADQDTYFPSHGGLYAAIVTNGEGCSDTTNCIQLQGVGLPGGISNKVAVFPNPFEDLIAYTGVQKGSTVQVFDARGALVLSQTAEGSEGQLTTTGLSPGLYLMVIETGEGLVRKKLVRK